MRTEVNFHVDDKFEFDLDEDFCKVQISFSPVLRQQRKLSKRVDVIENVVSANLFDVS